MTGVRHALPSNPARLSSKVKGLSSHLLCLSSDIPFRVFTLPIATYVGDGAL